MGGLGRGDIGLRAGFQFEFNPRILQVDPGVTVYTVVSSDDQILVPSNFPTGVYTLNLTGQSPGQVPLFDGQHLWISDPMGELSATKVLRVVGRAAGVGGQISTGGIPADFIDLIVPGTSLILTYSAALNTWDVLDGSASAAVVPPSSNGPSFVYREGEPFPSGNVFATWAGAYAAAIACRVDCLIAIDNALGQCHVTAGAYDMRSIAIRSFTPSNAAPILDFDDGVTFTGAFQSPLTLTLRNMGSAPVFTVPPGFGLSVVLDRGSILTCGPGAAPFLRVPNGALCVLPMLFGTRIANQPGAPVIQIDAGGTVQVIAGPISTVDQDVFAGAGTAVYLIVSSSSQFSTIQPSLVNPVQVVLATGARKVGIDDPTPRLVDAPTFPGNPSVQEGIDALRRGINTIIFRPGAPSRFPAYSLWTEIQQILSTSETPIHVLVDSSLAAADVPGFTGITDFRGGTLRAFDNNAIVAIRNGATLQNLSRIQGFGSDNLFPVVYECNTTPAFSFTGAPTNYALAFENVAFTANAGPNVALRLNPGDVLAIYGDSTTFPFGGGMIDNAGLLTITARKRGGAIAANYVPDDLVIGANPAATYTLFYDSDITGGLGFPTSPIPTISGFAGTYETIGLLSPFAIPTGAGIPVTADRGALPGEVVHVDLVGAAADVQITLPDVSKLPNGSIVVVKCVSTTALFSVKIVPFGGGQMVDGGPLFLLSPSIYKDWAIAIANVPGNGWDMLFFFS
jgi:hypothetical protein